MQMICSSSVFPRRTAGLVVSTFILMVNRALQIFNLIFEIVFYDNSWVFLGVVCKVICSFQLRVFGTVVLILPTTYLVRRRVMFPQMFVCLSIVEGRDAPSPGQVGKGSVPSLSRSGWYSA